MLRAEYLCSHIPFGQYRYHSGGFGALLDNSAIFCIFSFQLEFSDLFTFSVANFKCLWAVWFKQ